MTSSPKTTLSRTAVFFSLALAAAVAVLGGYSTVRKVETFQPIGFAAERQAGGWRVVEVTEPGTGLAPGDQILKVGGETAQSAVEMRELLTADETSTLLVLREGGDVEMSTVVYRRPGLAFDFQYLVLALCGAVYLLIGSFTLLRSRRGQGAIFFLWCVASAAIYLFTYQPPFDAAEKVFFIGEVLARILLPPLTLHLFLIFPTALSARVRRWVPFLYLPAAVQLFLQADLILLNGAVVFGSPSAAAQQALDRLEWGLFALFALAAIVALVYRRRSTVEVDERRQLRWVTLGVAGGYLPFVALYGLPMALGLPTTRLVDTVAVLPLALLPLTFAYAILRYKLWDIEVIVRQAIASTLTVVLAAIGFALINLLTRRVPEGYELARSLLPFVSGLALAGLMIPARRSIGHALERLQYRGSFGRRAALSELGEELLHQKDLDPLCADLIDRLTGAMDLERGNLYLHQAAGSDEDGNRVEGLVLLRPEPGLPAQLPSDVLGERTWQSPVAGISGLEPPGETLADARAGRQIYLAGYRYAFPLVVRDNRVGLMLLSYKIDGEPLNSEEIERIRQVLNQAALAVDNAQLLDRLHQKLDEVVRLQQYSQGVIESSPAGIAVLDADGHVQSANLAFAALVGEERRSLVGRPISEVLPVGLPAVEDGLVELALPGSPADEPRYLQASLARLGEGTGQRGILVVQDVSERVAMENALKQKDRLASLGMLAAGVAHEVNTPITGISSYAQMLLEETPEDDPRRELMRKVERQTFRAARIVSNLLEFARDRNREQAPVGVRALLAEVIDLVRDRMVEQAVELDWQPAEAGGLEVEGSVTELAQVFTNLVTNALDAMPDGGRLEVSLAHDESTLWVTVGDTGSGIPMEHLEKIFQPFYSTKLSRGGTGLGLSISYEIVHRHGGEIRVISQPGKGARFVVELPLLAEVGVASERDPDGAPERGAAGRGDGRA